MKRKTELKSIITILLSSWIISVAIVSCGVDDTTNYVARDIPIELLLSDNKSNIYDLHLDSAPDNDCEKLHVANVGPLRRAFLDSNYKHLQAADAFGTRVIGGLDDAWCIDYPLVEIRSCPEYFVDELTHSYPYLVPEAAELLEEIGRNFNDTLQARGGGNYRIKVTSVLRTPATVKRLRRINRNAVDSSSHQYATTFDISYSRFICDSLGVNRSFEDLKNLLAEILYKLRADERCYVVYERKQSCFHITVRP